jgi:hypothetical protein
LLLEKLVFLNFINTAPNGRLQDTNLENIISKMKANSQFKECKEGSGGTSVNDEHKRVLEAVKEGLLQVHGIAPNTKQPRIFRLMGGKNWTLTASCNINIGSNSNVRTTRTT